jgi:hypothetical protein
VKHIEQHAKGLVALTLVESREVCTKLRTATGGWIGLNVFHPAEIT